MSKPSVLLIASQMPQQELGIIAQLLMSQGYKQQPASERPKNTASIAFETADKTNVVEIKFYQEIGALRLELTGETSQKIGAALAQYMETLPPDRIGELFDQAQSDMERRIYAILLVLAYPDGIAAMDAIRDKYFVKGNEATREGIVQGFAFLETPDVGVPLEEIEKACKGQNIATLARRAIDGLSERGIIKESIESFINKVVALIDDNPKSALELIEKYENGSPVAEIRALHAKALRLLGQNDAALALLDRISIADPDAVDAYCERALLRETSGAVSQAMSDVQAALACDANCAAALEIHKRLSLVHSHAASSVEDRIAQYSQALEANPDDVNLLCQRAECLIETHQFNEALKDLNDAQKLAANDLRLPKLLCDAYMGKHWYGYALEQASKAQKVHVSTLETVSWLLKPKVFVAMNLPAKALDAIHAIPAELREYEIVMLCTAIVHEILGHTDEARAIYDELLGDLGPIVEALDLTFYQDMPLLRAHAESYHLVIAAPPASPLGDEPVDPFFKRCDACGALTMKRRTYCKDCNNGTFF